MIADQPRGPALTASCRASRPPRQARLAALNPEAAALVAATLAAGDEPGRWKRALRAGTAADARATASSDGGERVPVRRPDGDVELVDAGGWLGVGVGGQHGQVRWRAPGGTAAAAAPRSTATPSLPRLRRRARFCCAAVPRLRQRRAQARGVCVCVGCRTQGRRGAGRLMGMHPKPS
jgi:hypothetical protein